MSLINDMLRDLDARRAPSASNTMTALPTAGIVDGHASRQNMAYIAVGAALLLTILTVALISRAPTQVLLRLPHVPEKNSTPITAEKHTLAGKVSDHEPIPGLLAGKSTPTFNNSPAITKTEALVGAGLPANKPVNLEARAEIVIRTLSPEQKLARAFREATTAAGSGDAPAATRLLEDILHQDDNHHEARFLLANLYVRQQRTTDAESLLTSGLVRHPLHAPSAHLLARLLVAEERFNEAIRHLQTALAGAAQNADYHALLAGLYQRTGKPDAAARYFTLALELSPKHGEWWMGLGISQEQAGNNMAAQSAYRQALQHPLKTTLQHYINQRLQQLPPQAPLHGSINMLSGKV